MADEHLAPHSTHSFDSNETTAGRQIAGRYTLVEKIGEGGMGEVWVAKQSEPVKRKVALKLIKKGMDSRQVLARFEQERQALAVMDHPNIAKVLDGGLTDSGQPFFVMELVSGKSLTAFCDGAKLGIRKRLELLLPVCHAVQHAHQKGIIHRDLKPANILVATIDGKPTPKVIDFGVAKAVTGKLTEESLSTQFGAVVGTLEYMAPEQAGLTADDVDTRADVYSLGVVLYELLTGLRPFDSKRLRQAALDEVIRLLREEDPPSLASRLLTDESLASAAAVRGTEPGRLVSLVRGELDWIVRRCLEKDRNRRYETANGLARDVRRYLDDEPVEARPVGAGYRFKKFLRRNRGSVVAAGLVLLALIGGVVGTTWGMLNAQAARQREAERAEGERAAKEEAVKRQGQLEMGNEILAAVFADLDIRAVKQRKEPIEAALAKRLVKAAEQLDGEAVGDSLVVGRLQHLLGRSLRSLGHAKEAVAVITKALETAEAKFGPDHPNTLISMSNLAAAYFDDGKPERALPLVEKAFRLQKTMLGPDHRDTLASMNILASAYRALGARDRALPLLEDSLELTKAKFGPDHIVTFESMNNLALAYLDLGKHERALPLLEKASKRFRAELGLDHPDTLTSMSNLAGAYLAAGKFERALPLLEETLEFDKAKLGADHPDTLKLRNNLVRAYQTAGKHERGLSLAEEALSLRKAKLGADHPGTLESMNTLALAYQLAGKPERAIPLYEETLRQYRSTLDGSSYEMLMCMTNLARAYHATKKPDRAIPLAEEALGRWKAGYGPDHPSSLANLLTLAMVYLDVGKPERAAPLLEETLKRQTAKLGLEHPESLITMNLLAQAFQAAGNPQLALPILDDAIRGLERGRFAHPHASEIVARAALAYDDAKQYDKGEALLRKWLAVVRQQSGKESAPYSTALGLLGLHLLHRTRFAEAEGVLRECLSVREKVQPDVWSTLNTRSTLGGALLGQKKYADAEPLLLQGYEGMKAREKIIPVAGNTRIPEALDRLIELYTATNKPEEVKKWKAERAKYPPAEKTAAPPKKASEKK